MAGFPKSNPTENVPREEAEAPSQLRTGRRTSKTFLPIGLRIEAFISPA